MASPPFTPLGTRARWAVVFLAATVAVNAIAIWFDVWAISVIDRFVAGGDASTDALARSDDRQALIGAFELVLLLATPIFFIRWFHPAYRNIVALGATELRFKPGWAIGSWFVPFLSLWRPKQIADDIWRASDPDSPEAQGLAWRQGNATALLTLWWALWLISSFAAKFAGQVFFTADTLSDYRSSARLDAASLALSIAAAILAILVVRRTTSRQVHRAQRLGAQA